MNRKKGILVILLILVSQLSMLFISAPNMQSNIAIINEDSESPKLRASNGETSEVLVFFEESFYNGSVESNFTGYLGVINNRWNNTFSAISGFSGTLPTENISLFEAANPQATVETNEILEAQLNYISVQSGAINSTWPKYGYNGDINGSVAVMDTGINPNHSFFPDGFESVNLSGNIVGWKNYINSDTISDDNGHGTFVSSIISGTGNEPFNSSNPTALNLYGNYSHTELFGNDYVTNKNYTTKIFTFNVSKTDSFIDINASWCENGTNIDGFWFELYKGSTLVNYTYNEFNETYYQFNHNVSQSGAGIYDLYIKYHKEIYTAPEFSFDARLKFYPEFYAENYSYYTGISNASKIVSYKVLDNNGEGYVSNLISAMADVMQNKSKYHIISVCLSIGTIGEDVDFINMVIDEVIEDGTLVVIAAGNYGVGSDKINGLAMNENAIVVGATNDKDQLTSYTSNGGELASGVIKPDILAPGGSILPGNRYIVGADAYSNDTTGAYGTSIATAIVAGALNLMVEAKWSDWNQWSQLNLTEWVKTMKAVLLMTATEINLEREDDPKTENLDESEYSPTGTANLQILNNFKDDYEGYGRINIDAAINALDKEIEIGKQANGTLISSAQNPLGKHAFARRISLSENTQYLFNMTIDNPIADLDLYLYSNHSTTYGEPILLASSRQLLGDSNSFFFTPQANETDGFIVIKAISGNSSFTVNISSIENSFAPVLSVPEITYTNGAKNTTVLSYQEYIGNAPTGNFTIDTYLFFVNYTDQDISNVPPQEIYMSIVEQNKNYSLTQLNPTDDNFTNGVIYVSEQVKLPLPQTYTYFFIGSDGAHQTRFPSAGTFSITLVNPTSNEVPYSHSFNNGEGDWTPTGTGWDLLTQTHLNDDRSDIYSQFLPWRSMYFGYFHSYPLNYTYQPFFIAEPALNGSLTSPLFNLTQLEDNFNPIAKFGLRASINSLDFIYLQIRVNWSTWTTIETYTNIERDWFMEVINLTQYKGSYIQFRFDSAINDIFDPVKNGGFMLDYVSIENYSNDNSPEMEFTPFFDIEPQEGSKYAQFEFDFQYRDEDNNYPEYVLIEIGGVNISMFNLQGDWDATDADNGIHFKKSLVIGGYSNQSFRFHYSDGKNANTTEWYNKDNSLITLSNPDPIDFNYYKGEKAIGHLYSNTEIYEDFYIAGTPTPQERTAWIDADNTWHPTNFAGQDLLYGGQGDISYGTGNQGYGQNWNAQLITKPIYLSEEYDSYIEFTHNISLQNEFFYGGSDYDKCQISISSDYGTTWTVLKEYTYESDDLNGDEKIDISEYSEKTVMIRFSLRSNSYTPAFSIGFGWFIYDIYVGYDTAGDYVQPTINIKSPTHKETVAGTITIQAEIEDDIELNRARFQIYIEDESVDREDIKFDSDSNTLTYEWDTTTLDDGIYEIQVVAFDKNGNRQEATIIVEIDNGYVDFNKWAPWIIFILAAIVIGIVLYILAEKRGKIWIERIQNWNAEKERLKSIDRDQVMKRIEVLDEEEEMERPISLHCKNCKSWFTSDSFDIICPVCDHDQVYAAYNCLNCGKWYFKDEPGTEYYCKSKTCEGIRLVRQKEEDIQDILMEDGKVLREYEFKKKDYNILDI